MRAPRILAALLATAALVGAAAVPPAAAAAAPGGAAELIVAPRNGGLLPKGSALDVDVRVTNTGTARLAAGELAFSMERAPVANATELYSSIAKPVEVLLGRLTETTARTPALEPGASAQVRARIGADDADSILTGADGARLLYVQLTTDDDLQVVSESAVVRMSSRAPRIGFSTVVPITAPKNAAGVVDVDAQGTLTAAGGAWTRALEAARAMPSAAVALDPEVIASVRLAGESAPASATAFLTDLRALPNEFLRLPYADGDVTLQRAAGLTRSEPESFAATSAAATTAASPTAAPTPAPSAQPESEDLTDWDWSDTGFSWPVHGTTTTSDLTALGEDGVVLLTTDDLQDDAARAAAGPLASVAGARVLAADDATSRLLAAATGDGIAAQAALAPLIGGLATAAASRATPTVLAVAGRQADPEGLTDVLDLLDDQRWITGRSLQGVLGQDRAVGVRLRSGSIPPARVSTARTLVETAGSVAPLAAAVPDPQALLAPRRLALLGLLSAQWRGDDAGWSDSSSAATAGFSDVLKQVSIAPSDVQTVIGTDGVLKVGIRNALPQPVQVAVSATVDNGRLQFGEPVEVEVPPNSRVNAELGFRSIANGRSAVSLNLAAPDGARIATTTPLSVTVQAGFDAIVAVVLLTLLGLLLALGLYRNIIRRRRPKAAAS